MSDKNFFDEKTQYAGWRYESQHNLQHYDALNYKRSQVELFSKK